MKRSMQSSSYNSHKSKKGAAAATNGTDKREKTIVEEYIELLHEYQKKYGKKIVLFYQVGSFMEVYAVKSPIEGETHFVENPEIENIFSICGFNIGPKSSQTYPIICEDSGRVLAAPIYMGGMQYYLIEKHLTKLSNSGYTCIVYTQEPKGGSFVRKLECIVSCGTHITYEPTDNTYINTNYIMSIWVEKIKVFKKNDLQLLIGLSTTDIFTGKTYFFEYMTQFQLNPTNFDELERQISTFCPSEIIFMSNLEEQEIKSVLKFSNIKSQLIHYVDIEKNEKAQNCAKQRYIQHVFKTYLNNGENIFQTCIEFQTNITATQSFCYLLDFIHEHNPNLIKNITLPVIQNTSTRMILGNQTLKQLNLIEDGSIDRRVGGSGAASASHSSVLTFLNKSCTPMGRRLFHHQFVNPVFDVEWLNGQYKMIDDVITSKIDIDAARQILSSIKDIERMRRQIIIRRFFPSGMYSLYCSLCEISRLSDFIKSKFCGGAAPHEGGVKCYNNNIIECIDENIEEMKGLLEFLDNSFLFDFCKNTSSMTTFENNIFRSGYSVELDDTIKKYEECKAEFKSIYDYLDNLIGMEENSNNCIKIHETEKNGLSFLITKRRGIILKKILEKVGSSETPPPPQFITGIKFISASGQNEEITSPHIQDICKNIFSYKDKLNEIISRLYYKFLETFENTFGTIIEKAANFTAQIDTLICKAYIAKKYNYCKPQIDETTENSYVSAENLRHVLIEHINTSEIYVPNDVCLSEPSSIDTQNSQTTSGVLIYGVNTTGKTSYIRSVGIAIVMAQAGLYVPAQTFKYKPYKSIFSRILGNDNLFHGLSTFAVEMSELRVILKMADNNSLVIGDEVCSGTENQSALSIFVAALMELYEKQCSFLFATHFHEIVDYDEIREMKRLKIKHMSVIYDREQDCLIYERKLRDGAGYRMYGIEICKSLHMPDEFIEKAYKLRSKYYAEIAGALSHKQSTYNSNKIRGLCEKCGKKIARETHHISPQCYAEKDGFIESDDIKFHKNHLQNLMALCEKCHDEEHATSAAAPLSPPSPQITSTKKPVIRRVRLRRI